MTIQFDDFGNAIYSNEQRALALKTCQLSFGDRAVTLAGDDLRVEGIGTYRVGQFLGAAAEKRAKRNAKAAKIAKRESAHPLMVTVSGSASNEARAALQGRKAYLCQLLPNDDRRWAERQKAGAKGHPVFRIGVAPGMVIESRIAWYDADGTQARTFWAVVSPGGELKGIDRDTAHALLRVLSAPAGTDGAVMAPTAERMLPGCVSINSTSEEG